MKGWRQHALGALACAASAGILSFSFHGSKLQHFLPFLFLPVVTFVAERFGSAAGILGTLAAASIFAEFLFQPMLSLRVSDPVQRDNIIWMIIIGIIVSELLGVQPHKPHRGDPKGISGT